MEQYLPTIISIICAYLIGSISPAIRLSKYKGVNIMEEGSNHAGSTNVLRVMGKKMGIIVFILDVIKGAGTVIVVSLLAGELASYCASVFVVLGHCFSIFHHFKAGKGVAPGLGAMLAINWKIGLCVLAIAIIVICISKRVSIGSLCAAVSLPICTYFFEPKFFVFSFLIAVLIIFMHRSNIKRLLNDEEAPLSIFVKK